MSSHVATDEDWRALVGACPCTPLGRRDLLLLWCAYGLALSEQHAVSLTLHSVQFAQLELPNGRCVQLGQDAARAVVRVLREARILALELSPDTPEPAAFPLHPRSALKRLEAVALMARRPDLSWRKLRRGALVRAYRLDGWRVAERLAHAVDLSLEPVLELVEDDLAPAPLRTVPLLERTA